MASKENTHEVRITQDFALIVLWKLREGDAVLEGQPLAELNYTNKEGKKERRFTPCSKEWLYKEIPY